MKIVCRNQQKKFELRTLNLSSCVRRESTTYFWTKVVIYQFSSSLIVFYNWKVDSYRVMKIECRNQQNKFELRTLNLISWIRRESTTYFWTMVVIYQFSSSLIAFYNWKVDSYRVMKIECRNQWINLNWEHLIWVVVFEEKALHTSEQRL